jgi:hypothetical protein
MFILLISVCCLLVPRSLPSFSRRRTSASSPSVSRVFGPADAGRKRRLEGRTTGRESVPHVCSVCACVCHVCPHCALRLSSCGGPAVARTIPAIGCWSAAPSPADPNAEHTVRQGDTTRISRRRADGSGAVSGIHSPRPSFSGTGWRAERRADWTSVQGQGQGRAGMQEGEAQRHGMGAPTHWMDEPLVFSQAPPSLFFSPLAICALSSLLPSGPD